MTYPDDISRMILRYLQEAAAEIEKWYIKWKIKINAEGNSSCVVQKEREPTRRGN